MWFRLAMILCLAAMSFSCADGKQNEFDSRNDDLWCDRGPKVTEAQIKTLKVGMKMDEVVSALSPSSPLYLSCPAFLYDTSDGGQYYLSFAASDGGGYVLKYVIYMPKENDDTESRCVIPAGGDVLQLLGVRDNTTQPVGQPTTANCKKN